MADIVLLTESKISSDFNKYDEVAKISGTGNREDVLPHDIHLNIVLLGSMLKVHNFDVVLIDNFLHLNNQAIRLEQELEKCPMAVGISTTFFYDGHSIRQLINFIRKKSPTSCVILGGPSLLQFPELITMGDIAVLYDGDEVIVQVMAALKKKDTDALKEIPGLWLRQDKEVFFTGERPPIEMDRIPFPDWNLLEKSRDLVYPIETQRGCPYSCKYCTYPIYNLKGGKFRLKDNQRVIDELKRNYHEYGIYRYRICDSNFTAPSKRALELSSMIIQENLKIEWSCYGRVDNVTAELALAMKEAGCKVVFVGLESGSDTILHNMNKKFTQEEIYRGTGILKEAGLYITGSFIIGFPGETEQTIKETKKVITGCGLDSYLASVFWLDHNSLIWQERDDHSLSGKAMTWSHSTMDSTQAKALLASLLNEVFTQNGPPLGSDFDIVTLVNLGFSYKRAMQFIKDRHQINLNKTLKLAPTDYRQEKLTITRSRYTKDVMFLAKQYQCFQSNNLDPSHLTASKKIMKAL